MTRKTSLQWAQGWSLLLMIIFNPLGSMKSCFADDPISAASYNAMLQPCMNLSNHLGNSIQGWAILEDFENIADAGFNSVRISVSFSAFCEWSGDYAISTSRLAQIDDAVDNALVAGLIPILDFHGYGASLESGTYSTWHKDRFIQIWRNIANHFINDSHVLSFEILNEPHGNLNATLWNSILAETITAIRQTGGNNATRNLIIDTAYWSSYTKLADLVLPADDYLIVSIHCYEPMTFTHQGATWVTGADAWLGNKFVSSNITALQSRFDTVATWSTANSRPIFIGEFGAINLADPLSRSIFAEVITDAAVARGFSCAWWGVIGDTFGIYDPLTEEWDRSILNALLQGMPEFQIKNDWAGKCLNANNLANYSQLVTSTQSTNPSMIWQMVRGAGWQFWLRNKASGSYLNAAASTSGAAVNLGSYHYDWNSERWEFSLVSDDVYRLRNLWGSKYLNATSDSEDRGVTANTLNETWTSEKWQLIPVWR